MASPRPPGATGPLPSPNARAKSPGKGPPHSPGATRSSAPVRSPQSANNGRPNPQQGATSPGEAGAARSPPQTARPQSGGPGSAANSPPESPVSSMIKLNLGAKKAPVGTGGSVINGTSRTVPARVAHRTEGIDSTFAGSSSSSYASSTTRAYTESSAVESSARRLVTEAVEGGARRISPTKRPIEAGQLSPTGQPGPNKTTFVTRRPQQGGQGPALSSPGTSPPVQTLGSISPTRVGTKVSTSTTEVTTRTATSPTRVVTKVITSTSEGEVRVAGTKFPPQSTTANVTRSPGAISPMNGSGFTVQTSRTVGQTGQARAQSDAGSSAAKRRTVVSFADPREDETAEGDDSDVSGKEVTSAKVLRDRRPTGSPPRDAAIEQKWVDEEEYSVVTPATSAERTLARSAAEVSSGVARPKAQPATSPAGVSNGAGRVAPKAQQGATVKQAGKSPGTETDEQFQARKNALLSKFKERAGLPFPKPAEADTEAAEGDLGGLEQGDEVARTPTPVSNAMPVIAEETPRLMAAMVTPKKEELGVEGVAARVERKKAALAAANAKRPAAPREVVREAQIVAAEDSEVRNSRD